MKTIQKTFSKFTFQQSFEEWAQGMGLTCTCTHRVRDVHHHKPSCPLTGAYTTWALLGEGFYRTLFPAGEVPAEN